MKSFMRDMAILMGFLIMLGIAGGIEQGTLLP